MAISGASDGSGPLIDFISLVPAVKLVSGVQFGFGDTTCNADDVTSIVDSVMIQAGVFPSNNEVIETDMEPDTTTVVRRLRSSAANMPICRKCSKQWGVGVCRYWKGYCTKKRRRAEASEEESGEGQRVQRRLINWQNESFRTMQAKCLHAKILIDGYLHFPDTCEKSTFFCTPVEGYPGDELA